MAVVSSEAQMEKDVLPRSLDCQPHSVVYRLPNQGPQFLAGYKPEIFSVPCQVVYSNGQVTTGKFTSSKSTMDSVSQTEITVLPNIHMYIFIHIQIT